MNTTQSINKYTKYNTTVFEIKGVESTQDIQLYNQLSGFVIIDDNYLDTNDLNKTTLFDLSDEDNQFISKVVYSLYARVYSDYIEDINYCCVDKVKGIFRLFSINWSNIFSEVINDTPNIQVSKLPKEKRIQTIIGLFEHIADEINYIIYSNMPVEGEEEDLIDIDCWLDDLAWSAERGSINYETQAYADIIDLLIKNNS